MLKKTWFKNQRVNVIPDSYINRREDYEKYSFLVSVTPSEVSSYLFIPNLSEEPCIEIYTPLLRVMATKKNRTLIRLLYSRRESIRNIALYVLITRAKKLQIQELSF